MCFHDLPNHCPGAGVAGVGEGLRRMPRPVRKSLPLWVAAALPAMLAGHAAAYAWAGSPVADGRHAWFAPTLEWSAAALATICALLVATALSRSGILARTRVELSVIESWPRLALTQLLLFGAVETLEGHSVTLLAVAMQLAAAFCAACLLYLFSRLVERCIDATAEASRYLERLFAAAAVFAGRELASRTVALSVTAGHSRFQRPPPFYARH